MCYDVMSLGDVVLSEVVSHGKKTTVRFHCREVSREVRSHRREIERRLPGAGGRGNGRCCVMRADSVLLDEKSSGMGCTAM